MGGAPRLRVGASACLLGEEVRYDGGHKRDAPLLAALAPHVDLVRVCPEVELGMGVPREPIRLEGDPARPRLVGVRSGADHTAAMEAWAGRRVAELARLELDGYVLKSRSPSCGLAALVWTPGGATPAAVGRGAFARILAARLPDLPLAEETELHDPAARDAFLARVREHAARRGPSRPAEEA